MNAPPSPSKYDNWYDYIYDWESWYRTWRLKRHRELLESLPKTRRIRDWWKGFLWARRHMTQRGPSGH